MGIKERQERERESVRRAILDAARDLFVADGYQHVSIRKIAERIEYSPAAIYGYFASKDDIFFALAEEGFDLLQETAARVPPSDDPVATLKARLWSFYEFSKLHPEHFALMFLDRSVPRIRARYDSSPVMTQMKQGMAALIRQCVERGTFHGSVEPMAAFRILGAGVSGAAIAGLCHRLSSGEDADRLVHDVIEVLVGGFQAGVSTTFVATSPFCGSGEPDAERGAATPAVVNEPSAFSTADPAMSEELDPGTNSHNGVIS